MRTLITILMATAPIFAAEQSAAEKPKREPLLKRGVRVIVVKPYFNPKWEAANLAGGIVGNLIGQWMARPRGPSMFDNWESINDNSPRVESEIAPLHREPVLAPIAIFTIESSQPDSEVLVDSKPLGMAPILITLASGTRYIVVRRDGFRDWTQDVQANPGDALTVHAELKPIPEETFIITVKPATAPR